MIENTSLAEAVRGYIEYPCGCGKKAIVYESARGKVSDACPRCGKYAMFDYDLMEAVPSKASRGAIQQLKQKRESRTYY